MWIVYVLSFLFGVGIAWATSKIVDVIDNKSGDIEFAEKIGGLTMCVAIFSILVSCATTAAVVGVLTETDDENAARIERLEEQVKKLEADSQRDTVFIYRALDENDLK